MPYLKIFPIFMITKVSNECIDFLWRITWYGNEPVRIKLPSFVRKHKTSTQLKGTPPLSQRYPILLISNIFVAEGETRQTKYLAIGTKIHLYTPLKPVFIFERVAIVSQMDL